MKPKILLLSIYKCEIMEKSHQMIYRHLSMVFYFISINLLVPLLFIEIICHN